MIRKLICITICLALSLSCYTVSFAENTDVKDYSREISILKSIGIIKAYEDDGYISELNLTRGEAAFMICNMLDFTINTTGFEKSNGTIDWSGAAVKCLQENGYIHSEATKSSILYCDYIVLLLRALGYESLANYSGGYPTGYMKVAVDLDITNRGYSENATITKGEAAELMLNALETRILEPNSIKKGELVYSSSGVALNEYLDIYEGTGVLTQNYLTAVDSASGCASGYVRIGNELYEVENDSEEFLGEVIDFYYKDDGVDKKLLWAESDYEKKIKIMSDDIDSYADFTYKYSYNDRTKSIKILPSADIIYNGKFVSSLQDELYVPTNGYVEIIDTGNNSGYDLIKITNYSTAVIEYYNKDTNVLYDKFKKEIFKTDEDYFVFIGTEEKPLPENLVTDDVVSYRRSLDGEYTVLELNEQTVTGEILSTNSEPDTISIANKTYEIGYDLLNSGLYNGRPGDSVKIHLDLFGKVAYMTLMEASTTLGYLIKYHYDSYGIEDNIRVRLLTSDNTIETYDLAERIKIDGFSYKKSADVASVLSMYPSGVLAYKFNQDGKINYIDTPTYNRDKENENTLSVLTTRAELSYKGVTSIFSDRVAVDSSTICFSVPSAMSTDMRLYEKITKNKFVSTVKYDIATYRFDAGHGAADVIVLYDDPHIKIHEKLNKYSLEYLNDTISVTVVEFIGFEDVKNVDTLHDSYEIKNRIITYFRGNLPFSHVFEILSLNDTQFAVLVSGYGLEEIKKILIDEMGVVEEYYGIKLKSATGCICDNVLDINKSFVEALLALKQVSFNDSNVINVSDIELKSECYYPIEVEHLLIETVLKGEEEKTRTMLANIVANNDIKNMEELKQLMLMTIKRILHVMKVDLKKEYLDSMEYDDEKLSNVRAVFCNLATISQNEKQEGKKSLWEDILIYIDNNYMNDISLTEIAQKFNISTGYVCQLFRENNAFSFKEYLNRYRIEKAKLFLLRNEYKVNTVGEMVGFMSPISFNRVFKKYEGITPGAYKEKIMSEDNVNE